MQKRNGKKGTRVDWRSLRTRGTIAVGAVALVAALAWVATSLQASHAHRIRVAEARVAGTARGLAHSFENSNLLEQSPTDGGTENDLSALARVVAQDLAPGATVRIARPDPSVSSLIGMTPHQPHAAAFQVLGTSVEKDPATTVDYLAEMDPAITEGRTVVLLQGDQAVAFAPVRDEWNHALALVRVADRYQRGFWMRLGDIVLRLTVALGGAALITLAADRALRSHASNLLDIAHGYAGAVLERSLISTEVLQLAGRLAKPLPGQLPAEGAAVSASEAAPVTAGKEGKPGRRAGTAKRAIFDPRKLIERVVQPFRKRAAGKDIEITIVAGADVPRRLIGSPRALAAALHVLLENAVSYTRRGTIQLRITRVLERPEYRFEVVDTGVGIAWQAQPSLDESVRQAAGRDPREFSGGLGRASAIAARLGGELGFESQPGSGSRFFLTSRCEPVEAQSRLLTTG